MKVSSLHDVINYLFRYSSEFLLISRKGTLTGFIETPEVIALSNIYSSISEIEEKDIKDIRKLKNSKFEGKIFPLLDIHDSSIDFISRNELLYLTGNSDLDINFEAVLKNFPLPVLISDRFGKIVFANLKFLEVMKVYEEEIISIDANLIIPSPKNKTKIKGKDFFVNKKTMIVGDIKINVITLIPIENLD
jgi:PAS domain-containing protein